MSDETVQSGDHYFLRDEVGVLPTVEMSEQLSVMSEALQLYEERELKYQGLWKTAGYRDSALHIGSKARRVEMVADRLKNNDPTLQIDDALDLINYACFFIRNVRAGRG